MKKLVIITIIIGCLFSDLYGIAEPQETQYTRFYKIFDKVPLEIQVEILKKFNSIDLLALNDALEGIKVPKGQNILNPLYILGSHKITQTIHKSVKDIPKEWSGHMVKLFEIVDFLDKNMPSDIEWHDQFFDAIKAVDNNPSMYVKTSSYPALLYFFGYNPVIKLADNQSEPDPIKNIYINSFPESIQKELFRQLSVLKGYPHIKIDIPSYYSCRDKHSNLYSDYHKKKFFQKIKELRYYLNEDAGGFINLMRQ